MRAVRASLAVALVVSSSCTARERAEPRPPAPKPVAAEAPKDEQPGLDNFDAASDDMLAGDDPSKLHAFSPGADYCLEMYSACSGTPPLCTSAQFRLSCGESAVHPASKVRVSCVCP